jgi:hypothetical protein
MTKQLGNLFHHFIETEAMNFSLHCKVLRNRDFGFQCTDVRNSWYQVSRTRYIGLSGLIRSIYLEQLSLNPRIFNPHLATRNPVNDDTSRKKAVCGSE